MMNGYRVRFEFGRGHRMVLEGKPPIGSEEIDDIQYRMLRANEIPGLLLLETEEMDGAVAMRYSLSGRRMLSQAMRGSRWRMEDVLTLLCRLAEALEMSREYMLDLERYVLDDDYIFVGESWHDLAFTYLPLWRLTASVSVASDIERLIVRWMMNVEKPDGTVMQQLLRLTSSPDFAPARLRSFARRYLAEGVHAPEGINVGASPAAMAEPKPQEPESEPTKASAEGDEKSPWFASFREAAKAESSEGLSGWLGEEDAAWGAEREERPASSERDRESVRRRRIWLVSAAAALAAGVWRFVYLPHPDARGLGISAAVTLLAAGCCFWLWNGGRRHGDGSGRAFGRAGDAGRERAEDHSPSARAVIAADPEGGEGMMRLSAQEEAAPRLGRFASMPEAVLSSAWGSRAAAGSGVEVASEAVGSQSADSIEEEAGTSWLGASADGTRLLDKAAAVGVGPIREFFLEWDSSDGKRKICLSGNSLVIGRSKEAAQHVDDTEGVSRAHLEIVRGQEAWQARDLGSRNGSWLNGVPMAPYESYPLSKGDSLQIASSLYRYGER